MGVAGELPRNTRGRRPDECVIPLPGTPSPMSFQPLLNTYLLPTFLAQFRPGRRAAGHHHLARPGCHGLPAFVTATEARGAGPRFPSLIYTLEQRFCARLREASTSGALIVQPSRNRD